MGSPTTYRDGTLARRETLLREARIAMLRDHGAHVNVDTVARRIATSRRQLQRVFELSDLTFRETLTAIRMRNARRLLKETDMPIGEVCTAAGYSKPAQFSKAFRAYHETTPRAYRQESRSFRPSG